MRILSIPQFRSNNIHAISLPPVIRRQLDEDSCTPHWVAAAVLGECRTTLTFACARLNSIDTARGHAATTTALACPTWVTRSFHARHNFNINHSSTHRDTLLAYV